MKAKKLIWVILIAFSFTTCKKEKQDLCQTELCKDYYSMWKKMVMVNNDITESYFNEHFYALRTGIRIDDQGEFFEVKYKLSIDWMEAELQDNFPVRIEANNITFPQVDIQRGDYLNYEDVKDCVDGFAFSSKVIYLKPAEELVFSKQKKALKELRKIVGDNKLKFRRYRFKEESVVFTPNGHPYLYAVAEGEGTCSCGEIDLITGEGEGFDCPCTVN